MNIASSSGACDTSRIIKMRDAKGHRCCSFPTGVFQKEKESAVPQAKPCHTDVADGSRATVEWQEPRENHVVHNEIDMSIRKADTVLRLEGIGVAHHAFQQINKRGVLAKIRQG